MGILRNIREVLGTLKHREATRIYCPRCASPNIHLFGSLEYFLTPKKYVCEGCGYVGPIVMELEKEENSGQPSS
jgi:transposase-like protein